MHHSARALHMNASTCRFHQKRAKRFVVATTFLTAAFLVFSPAQAKEASLTQNTINQKIHDGHQVQIEVLENGYAFDVLPVGTLGPSITHRCLDYGCQFQEPVAKGPKTPLRFKGTEPSLHLLLDNGREAHFVFRKLNQDLWRIASIADAGSHPAQAMIKDQYDQRVDVTEEQSTLLQSIFLMQQYDGISIGTPLEIYDDDTQKRLALFVRLGGVLLIPSHRVDDILSATNPPPKEVFLTSGTLVAGTSSVVSRSSGTLKIGGRRVHAGAVLSYKAGHFDDVEATAAFIAWHLDLKRAHYDLSRFAQDIAASRSVPSPPLGWLLVFGLGWLLLVSTLLWQGRKQPWQKIIARFALSSAVFTTLIIGSRFVGHSAQSEVVVHRILKDGTEHSTSKATSVALSRFSGTAILPGQHLNVIGSDGRKVAFKSGPEGAQLQGARLQRIISSSRSVGSGVQVYQENRFTDPTQRVEYQTIVSISESRNYSCTPQLSCEQKHTSYDASRMISNKLPQQERALHARIVHKASELRGKITVAIGVDDDDTLHIFLKEGQ